MPLLNAHFHFPALRQLIRPALLAGFLLASARLDAANFNPGNYLTGSGYRAHADSMLVYGADSLSMTLDSRRSYMQGSARMSFIGMELSSPTIVLDWQEKEVEAWSQEALDRQQDGCGGSLELGADQQLVSQRTSSGPPSRSSGDDEKSEAWPRFSDGSQTLYGASMRLDLDSRQGYILAGRTAEDQSLYGGDRIKRVDEDELHVADAVFTTCDESCPHFHFQARQLKMLLKDKVFAKDVTLHFGRVPTLYSPVAMFSLKRGRASGLILPSYGETDREGRKLDHLGWYWAASQYWDTQLRMSYAENGPDWLFENFTRYVKNRGNKGNLAASYNLSRTTNREGWDLHWSHNQEVTPYISLRAKVSMASSDDYYKDKSDNYTTSIRQNLTSSIQLSGRFPEQGLTWSLGATGNQNLVEESTSGQLPAFTLSYPTYQPLGFLAVPGASPLASWLGGAALRLSSEARNQYTMKQFDLMDAESDRGARHTASLSFPGKFGVFSLTPSLSATSVWVLETEELKEDGAGGLDTLETSGFAARQTFSSGLTAATKLYGVAYLKAGRLEALRHVLSPSMTLNWTPDFSKESWGYVQRARYLDAEGQWQEARLDRFGGSIYGSTPSSESLRLNMRLGQLFQSKWKVPPSDRDSLGAGEVQFLRSDLLNLSSSASLDLLKDSLKLSDISSSWSMDPLRAANIRLGMLQSLSISASTTHSPYHYDEAAGRIDNRYVWLEGPDGSRRLPRLTRSGFDVTLGLKGGTGGSLQQAEEPEEDEDEAFFEQDGADDELMNRFAPEFGSFQSGIPWSLQLSWSWSMDHMADTKRSSLRANGSLKMSANWSVSGSVIYNPEEKTFGSRSLRINRDMHCWEGALTWDPEDSSYHLLIRVKSNLLEDLKWDKRRGRNTYLP